MGKTWERLRAWASSRRAKTTTNFSTSGEAQPDIREQMKSEIGGNGNTQKEAKPPRPLSREEAIEQGVGAYMKSWAILAEGPDADFAKARSCAQEGTMLFGALLFAKYGMTSKYAEEVGFGLGVVTMIAAGQMRAFHKRQRDEQNKPIEAPVEGEPIKRGPGRPPKQHVPPFNAAGISGP